MSKLNLTKKQKETLQLITPHIAMSMVISVQDTLDAHNIPFVEEMDDDTYTSLIEKLIVDAVGEHIL